MSSSEGVPTSLRSVSIRWNSLVTILVYIAGAMVDVVAETLVGEEGEDLVEDLPSKTGILSRRVLRLYTSRRNCCVPDSLMRLHRTILL